MIQHSTGTIWVGMDVHQSSITAAILHGDSPEPEVVRLPGDLNATRRLFRRLAEHGTPLACYEASGAGYVLQRTLDHDGFHCEVIASSNCVRASSPLAAMSERGAVASRSGSTTASAGTIDSSRKERL